MAAQGDAAPLLTLADIIAFNTAHAGQCLPYGQALAEAAQRTDGLDAPAYHADRLRDITLTRALGIDAVCRQYGLDALLTPGGAAAKLTGKAGYPAVTVPAGFADDGTPVGVSFIGPAFSEGRLLALAHAFEHARGQLTTLPDGL